MKVTHKTAKAQWESVEHWYDLWCKPSDKIYNINCPNCRLFYCILQYKNTMNCYGCPIQAYTKEAQCNSTPWIYVADLVENCDIENTSYDYWQNYFKEFRKRAEAEYRFLVDVAMSMKLDK